MSKRKTVSFTVGADLDGSIEVTHDIYETPVKHHQAPTPKGKAFTKSKPKPRKKGIRNK